MPTRALETARLARVAEARLDAVDGEESTKPNGGRKQHSAAPPTIHTMAATATRGPGNKWTGEVTKTRASEHEDGRRQRLAHESMD